MRMKFWVIQLHSSEGVRPFPVFTDKAPTLLEMLTHSKSFSEAWKGELPTKVENGEVTEWSRPVDTSHRVEVVGPFKSPRLHDTFVVNRPGAFFGRIAVQAMTKAAALTLIKHTFGCIEGATVTRMLPFRTRILAPIL